MRMMAKQQLAVFLALAFLTASASADSFVYVVNFSQQFGTIDLTNGAFNAIGPGIPEGSAGLVAGPGGTLLTLTVSGNLDAINPATGAVVSSLPTGLGGNANSLAQVGGTLYATDFNNNLYTVNPTTGVATLVGPTGIPAVPAPPFTTNIDGSLNLFDESLYDVGGKLYATFDAFSLDANGYTLDPSPDPSVPPELYQIDPTTGIATLVSPTAEHILSTVEVGGTFYAFQGTINSTYNFFDPGPLIQEVTLDLSNGNTSVVTNLDPAAGPIFGAVPDVPEPAPIALLGTGLTALAACWRRVRPGQG